MADTDSDIRFAVPLGCGHLSKLDQSVRANARIADTSAIQPLHKRVGRFCLLGHGRCAYVSNTERALHADAAIFTGWCVRQVMVENIIRSAEIGLDRPVVLIQGACPLVGIAAVAFYTHISDQFGPFHTKIIAATTSEAPQAPLSMPT
jgi:hypothetical protein